MFEINEMKMITRIIGQPFFLSPRSTLEYIMYHDIDQYEIVVSFDLKTWLEQIRRRFNVKVIKKDSILELEFLDERFTLKMIKSSEKDFLETLEKADFNVESVAIKVCDRDFNSFNKYQIGKETFYAKWVDPYHKRMSIQSSFIEPIDFSYLEQHGNLLYKMIHLMAKYKFDLHNDMLNYLKMQKHRITYSREDLSYKFFQILSYENATRYLILLDELGALTYYPLIQQMKSLEEPIFENGLRSLSCFEEILRSPHYFRDSVSRAIKKNLKKGFPCGLRRLQLLKFSILFYHAHKTMQLKVNAPERYEKSFVDFCSYFHLGEEACQYYSHIVKSSRETLYRITKDPESHMSLADQYDFFDEFQENTLDVILIQYVNLCVQLSHPNVQFDLLETYMETYISRFCEVQSINSEITTLELERAKISDAAMLILIDEVKRKVFLGNLRYDRGTILEYIKDQIK